MIKRTTLGMALLVGGLMAANAANAPATTPVLQAKATTLPTSRVEGRDAMEGSIAAALVGAVAEQFATRLVEVRIDRLNIATTSVVDRAVDGHGRLQLDGGGEWLAFEFRTGYDTRTTEVLAPQLLIGTQGRAQRAGAPVAQSLLADVRRQMREEFADQPFTVAFERVTVSDASARYQRVDAIGRADFASEGSAKTAASALLDRKTGRLLNVQYDIGTEATWATVPASGAGLIASR